MERKGEWTSLRLLGKGMPEKAPQQAWGWQEVLHLPILLAECGIDSRWRRVPWGVGSWGLWQSPEQDVVPLWPWVISVKMEGLIDRPSPDSKSQI